MIEESCLIPAISFYCFRFLKHVERTKLLLFVVDLHGFRLGPMYPIRSALETILLLNRELELYRPDFAEKPGNVNTIRSLYTEDYS